MLTLKSAILRPIMVGSCVGGVAMFGMVPTELD
jgi:hypothetical protein